MWENGLRMLRGAISKEANSYELTNARAPIQNALGIILFGLERRTGFAHPDNVIVYYSSAKEPLRRVANILLILMNANVSLESQKY